MKTEVVTCATCHGTGELGSTLETYPLDEGSYQNWDTHYCDECGGTGEVEAEIEDDDPFTPAQIAEQRVRALVPTNKASNPFAEVFKDWLVKELTTQDVTVQALGSACGVSPSHIYKVINCQHTSIKSMVKIAAGLGYEVQLQIHPTTTR